MVCSLNSVSQENKYITDRFLILTLFKGFLYNKVVHAYLPSSILTTDAKIKSSWLFGLHKLFYIIFLYMVHNV
jgi:hypothetical protein